MLSKNILYQVSSKQCSTLGALLFIQYDGRAFNNIQCHEQVDLKQAAQYQREFSNGLPQKSPIILGVESEAFASHMLHAKTTAHMIHHSPYARALAS